MNTIESLLDTCVEDDVCFLIEFAHSARVDGPLAVTANTHAHTYRHTQRDIRKHNHTHTHTHIAHTHTQRGTITLSVPSTDHRDRFGGITRGSWGAVGCDNRAWDHHKS